MNETNDIALGWESVKGFLANGVMAVFGFIGSVVFARILGPSSFGGFYFLLSLVYVVDKPIRGVDIAIQKRFSEANSRRSELLGTVLLLNGVLLLIGWILITGTDLLGRHTNVPSAELVFFLIWASFLYFFPFQSALKARGRPAFATWLDAVRSILTLAFQISLVSLGLGAAGMGYGLAGATLLLAPVSYYYVRARPAIPSLDVVQSVWSYAKYSVPSSFVGEAFRRFDILLIGAVLTQTIAGQYEVAWKLTLPATFLSAAITSALLPKISNAHSKEEDPSEYLENALSYASVLSIPIFFGVLAFPTRLVVTVYGPEYAEAGAYLVGLALYQVLVSQAEITGSTISALNRPDLNLRIAAVSLSINVALGVALITVVGGIGVVVATVVAEFCRLILRAVSLRRILPAADLFPRILLKQCLAGVVLFLFVEALTVAFVLDAWWKVGGAIGAGAAIYGCVSLLFSPELRTTVYAVYRDAVR